MKVSIIIRTTARESFFKALQSAQNQDYKNIEIVVIEDGSNNLQNKLPPDVKYISVEPNIGRSAAGNLGLGMATGEYAIFLDDDDEFLENHISSLVETAKSHPNTIIASLAYEVGRDKNKDTSPYLLYTKYPKNTIYSKNFLPINAVMFPLRLFKSYGGFDTDLEQLEDWVLWAKYLKYMDLIYTNKITAIYYVPFSLKNYFSRRKIIKNHYNVALSRVLSYAPDNFVKANSGYLTKTYMLLKLIYFRLSKGTVW